MMKEVWCFQDLYETKEVDSFNAENASLFDVLST